MKAKALITICIAIVTIAILIVPCFASVDWAEYTNSNLLPLPYTSGAPSANVAYNGVAFGIQEDGTIQIAGTALFSTTFYFARNVVLENKTYNYSATLSLATLPTGVWIGFDVLNNGYWQSSTQANTDFVGQTDKTYDFYVNLQAGNTYSFTLQPMLSAGAGQKAYQPYIPYFIEQAENTMRNTFQNATYTVMADSGDYDTETFTAYTPQLVTNGILLDNIYNWLNTLDGTPSDWAITITINWTQQYTWDYLTTPIYISSAYPYFRGTLTTSTQVLNLTISQDTNAPRPAYISAEETITQYPVNISAITFQAIPGEYVKGTTLTTFAEVYNIGFANGYTEGLRGNDSDIYSAGKADGYKNGFIEGKAEGLALSETGDWRSLISAVLEAPVNTFQSLFSFEVLGMDMRQAIGAILALCVILIIIKKVVL